MTFREFHVFQRIVTSGLALLALLSMSAYAPGAQGETGGLRLIMVEEAGCHFCRRWDKEVGVAYPASAEGLAAPLLRVRREAPELAGLKPVVYTPTFILARDGREIGRIPGYPGESFFWEELAELLKGAGITTGVAN